MTKQVIICRQPGDYNTGIIDINSICNVHWDNLSGGVKKRSGFYNLYGYIDYKLAPSLVSCSGQHNMNGNQAKICIPMSLNRNKPYIDGYKELQNQAGPKPQSIIASNRPHGAPPCTKAILSELSTVEYITRSALRNILLAQGYKASTILSALRSLSANGKIFLEGSSSSPNQKIRKGK